MRQLATKMVIVRLERRTETKLTISTKRTQCYSIDHYYGLGRAESCHRHQGKPLRIYVLSRQRIPHVDGTSLQVQPWETRALSKISSPRIHSIIYQVIDNSFLLSEEMNMQSHYQLSSLVQIIYSSPRDSLCRR